MGFSLIELMIVVAIIGILASIAVPNFQRFQSKARQSEAKGNLSAIFAAEKAFQAEWQTFFGAFLDIGFAPEGDMIYGVGFPALGPALPANYLGTGMAIGATFQSGAYCPGEGMALCRQIVFGGVLGMVAAGAVAPTNVAFTAGAGGNIDTDGTLDEWTINQQKIVVNTVSDISM